MNRLCPVLSVACTPSDNLPSFSSIPPPDEALAALTELILQTSPLEGLRCFCELRWTCGSGAYGSSPRPASLAAMKTWEVLGRLSVGPPYTLGKVFQPPGHTGLDSYECLRTQSPTSFLQFYPLLRNSITPFSVLVDDDVKSLDTCEFFHFRPCDKMP